MSSSPIYYKFRSGKEFIALPLPGKSFVRLFDVKRAIVKSKFSGRSMDFDLCVTDAKTNEQYSDESMMLPRETRLIVRRVPVAKGQLGIVQRMERDIRVVVGTETTAAPDGFYTIDSRDQDDEEFVTAAPPRKRGKIVNQHMADEQDKEELLALKAVIESTSIDSIPVPSAGHKTGQPQIKFSRRHTKPNADPGLRKLEEQLQPKKHPKSVPVQLRPDTSGEGPIRVVPGGFNEITKQVTGTNNDFNVALAISGAKIPAYLKCGACNGLLENAMCLHWDLEGRSACERCIRESVSRYFRCPVTGTEGISPDDLHPNKAIQRAADTFREDVKAQSAKIQEVVMFDDTARTTDRSSRTKRRSQYEGGRLCI